MNNKEDLIQIFNNPYFIKLASIFFLVVITYVIVKILQKATFKIAKDNS